MKYKLWLTRIDEINSNKTLKLDELLKIAQQIIDDQDLVIYDKGWVLGLLGGHPNGQNNIIEDIGDIARLFEAPGLPSAIEDAESYLEDIKTIMKGGEIHWDPPNL